MKSNKHYDLWDIDKPNRILADVEAKVINKYLGDSKFQPCVYAKEKLIYKRQYMVTYAGEKFICTRQPHNPNPNRRRSEVWNILLKEWDKVCKPFRKVEWVKEYATGIKKLEG